MYKLLLVEDNEDNMELLEAMLEDDFSLIQAKDGLEALAQLKKEIPSLILMDIAMPNMTGEEALIHIKKDPRTANIPVIALTAHAMVGDKEKYLALGFTDYISKPIIDDVHLIQVIEKYI